MIYCPHPPSSGEGGGCWLRGFPPPGAGEVRRGGDMDSMFPHPLPLSLRGRDDKDGFYPHPPAPSSREGEVLAASPSAVGRGGLR